MAKYVRYYKDSSGAPAEYTGYVDLAVTSCTHTISRSLEVIPGNAGGNTYADDQRYTQKWTITASVDLRTQDALRGFAVAAFDGNTTLRVYDEYTAPNYTDYGTVKMLSYKSETMKGDRYTVTLVVVK